MEPEEKVRENRLRRMAARQGLTITKSRRRDPRAVDFGGYMLTDASTTGVVLGGGSSAYSSSLDDIEDYLTR